MSAEHSKGLMFVLFDAEVLFVNVDNDDVETVEPALELYILLTQFPFSVSTKDNSVHAFFTSFILIPVIVNLCPLITARPVF